jgi:hypothetical protein
VTLQAWQSTAAAVEAPPEVAMGEAEANATKLTRRRVSILEKFKTAMVLAGSGLLCVGWREGGEGEGRR